MNLGCGTRKRLESLSVSTIGEPDARFIYQAYRLDQLPFPVKKGLTPQEFIAGLESYILQSYQFSWSVRENGKTTVIVFGKMGFHSIDIGDPIWNVKSTPRQKIETGLFFYSTVGPLLVTVGFKDKKYHELFCDYGVLRRVGTIYINGIRHAQFQTRAK